MSENPKILFTPSLSELNETIIPKLKEMAKQAKIIGNRNYSKERFIEIVKTEVISKFPQK